MRSRTVANIAWQIVIKTKLSFRANKLGNENRFVRRKCLTLVLRLPDDFSWTGPWSNSLLLLTLSCRGQNKIIICNKFCKDRLPENLLEVYWDLLHELINLVYEIWSKINKELDTHNAAMNFGVRFAKNLRATYRQRWTDTVPPTRHTHYIANFKASPTNKLFMAKLCFTRK